MIEQVAPVERVQPPAPARAIAARPVPARPAASPGDRLAVQPPPLPGYGYTANNQVDVFFGAPAIYQAMEDLVASAQRSIKMDFFILGGNQAMRLAEVLAAKAKAGVKVQVIVDPWLGVLPAVSRQGKQLIAYLEAQGVQVAKSNLVALPPNVDRKDRRAVDHNKLIVVDDRRALGGGMNLADEFDTFHDVMVKVEGPAAAELGRQLDYDWHFARHPDAIHHPQPPKPPRPAPSAIPASDANLATVRVNSTGVNRQTHRAAILEVLRRAERTIDVAMLHLADDQLIDALIAAHKRGVQVRVLLDAEEFGRFIPFLKNPPNGMVNSYAIHRLQEAGVDVRHFRPNEQQTNLHQKMAVVDGRTLLVGSTNWTPRALDFNSETSLEIHGGPAPGQALAQFDRDWAEHSMPVEAPGNIKRSLAWIYSYVL